MRLASRAEITRKYKGKYTKKNGETKKVYDPALGVPPSVLKRMGWYKGYVKFIPSNSAGAVTLVHEDNVLKVPYEWTKQQFHDKLREELARIPKSYRVTESEFRELEAALEGKRKMTKRLNDVRRMYNIYRYIGRQICLVHNLKLKVDKIYPETSSEGQNKD